MKKTVLLLVMSLIGMTSFSQTYDIQILNGMSEKIILHSLTAKSKCGPGDFEVGVVINPGSIYTYTTTDCRKYWVGAKITTLGFGSTIIAIHPISGGTSSSYGSPQMFDYWYPYPSITPIQLLKIYPF